MAAPKNPVTHLARLHKRNRRAAGDLDGARKRLWRALEMAEACMMDAASDDDRVGVLKAVHATTQAAAAFARLVEVGELEGRLAALAGEVERLQAERVSGGVGAPPQPVDARAPYPGATA